MLDRAPRLRRALLWHACFSAACATLFLAAREPLAGFLGLADAAWALGTAALRTAAPDALSPPAAWPRCPGPGSSGESRLEQARGVRAARG